MVACAFALLACSGDDKAPNDAGSEADVAIDAGYPGPHPAPPQVLNQQGPVLATPRVVPIFFANDAYQSQVEDFLAKLAASPYWTATTTEYGVGAMTVAPSIVTTDPPPQSIDLPGIEAFLAKQAQDPNDVFAVFYPSSTTINDPRFGTSCTDFNGFHYQGITNTQIVYAVIPRCASAGALTGFDAISASLSHELVEAATDPFLDTSAAWAFPDVDHLVWSYVPGAEVADMCDLEPQSFQPLVGSYFVQRSWSNASALAGHDPCVPVLAQPYFVAAPVLTAKQNITFQAQVTTTNGVKIPVGDTQTIEVQLFSDAPTSDWNVDAIDVKDPAGFTFSWDRQTGNNGDTLHLTITRTLGTSSEFAIESHSGTTTNLWFGFVAD
jgi:hypothetical protein